MHARSLPHLGWDPTPGDVDRAGATAGRVAGLTAELDGIMRELEGADPGRWTGAAALAFQASMREDLVPLLRTARDSFDRAGSALRGWVGKLSLLQDEADRLDREAGLRQEALASAQAVAANPPAGADQGMLTRLQDGVGDARTSLNAILARAQELHERYLSDAKDVGDNLNDAGGIAPDEPGWLDRAVGAVSGAFEDFKDAAGEWIRENAEVIKFVGDVLGTISAVAGLLSFIPPLTAIMLPLAAVTAAGSAGLHGALLAADAEGASWMSFGTAMVGAVAGLGAIRAGAKLVQVYRTTGRSSQLRNVRTLTGTVTGKTTPVAPGMFSMARSGAPMTQGEFGTRLVQLKANQAGVTAIGIGSPSMVDSARQWGRNVGADRAPWASGAR